MVSKGAEQQRTQKVILIKEATRRVYGCSVEYTEDRPSAVLLDITKAHLRTNKPLLWGIFGKLGMTQKVLGVLKGLHEGTHYRVKEREGLCESWMPARGLREGCATSPILFNVYYAKAMREAQRPRKIDARRRGLECGLE